ncbi:hypothetical protein Ga0074812_13177 [Parafrankia irregularis]|uniref:Uncharacterized protein n=1 Tax=Parafrankia irregularis TaxID=795642 RepID=A0A0S4QVY5_9ACTN|nr:MULTISPECIES: hypothetical protein [Parafrankia]MBE3200349.1 hypothetical protein [Parafrankia sp. CH37]CUU59777.1 hypothetical protein Ga0074812_13177 [Parafrankia irregularis]
MDETLSRRIQIVCAYAGIAYVILYGITFIVLPHNYPPPDPSWSAAELVQNYYLKHHDGILLGQTLSAATGVLYMVWCSQLSVQMWRREPAPILSLLQLTGGLLTVWVVMFPPAMWAWCAANAGSVDPEIIRTVHLVGWYCFDITYWITTIEGIAVFLLVLKDRTQPALMPKWAGWLALVASLSFIPLSLVPYHNTGPFAINGWFNFHVVFITFGLFIAVCSYYQVVDLKRPRIPATPGLAQAIGRSQVTT